jgi:hypothetical protein
MPVRPNIQVEICLIRKTHMVQESLICANFLQHFFTKPFSIVFQEKIAELRSPRRRITEKIGTVTEVKFVNTRS